MNYTPEQKANWDSVIHLLQDNLSDVAQSASFNTWIKPLKLHAVTPSTIVIICENAFSMKHIQSHYATMLYSTVKLVFNRTYELEFHTPSDIQEAENSISDADRSSTIDPRYTFDNFIVGASNSFAYAAALAVAESFSDAYNPFFIYGGVGLGKTHLMNAIGNYIARTNPSARLLLMTSEAMTNELIEGIVRKRTSDLRSRTRNVDVLMVDDIQFLSKTKATQEEFFHTFNDLYSKNKQIIISSDRPPKEIPEIEERLRSRFAMGLIVDIQKPDFETRMAILKQKAADNSIDVPGEVLEYIAQNVSSNIRELEGCLTSLNAHANLMHAPITLELAQNALSNRISAQSVRKVNAESIIEAVAGQYGVTAEDIRGKKRSRDVTLPRQIAIYICREMTGNSTTVIGKSFGGRDHTTVMHACDRISDSMKTDFAFKKRIEELMGLIQEH